MRRCMYITSPKLPGGVYPLLNDTGAQLSAVSLQLIRRHRLHYSVHGPRHNDPQYILLADRNKKVKRIGTINLPVSIQFSGGKHRAPYTCSKTFEVIDMKYDFILGVDILPHLFPTDDIMNYILLPSKIASPPVITVTTVPASTTTDANSDLSLSRIVSTQPVLEVDHTPTLQYATRENNNSDVVQSSVFDEYVQDRISDYYFRMCMMDVVVGEEKKVALDLKRNSSPKDVRVTVDAENDDRIVSFEEIEIASIDNIEAELNMNASVTSDDVISLSEQISDIGIGDLPPHEIPDKPSASTPPDRENQYKHMRQKILAELSDLLKANESITGFCNSGDSVVKLSVRPEDEEFIYSRQYPIPHALEAVLDAMLEKWFKQGRIMFAPHGCKFNSPLLVAKKKDEHGRMTGIRVCLDVRKLNKYLLENDRFQIPHIPDMLATLAGGKIFGEFDLSEAYFQFKLAVESQMYTAFTWKKQQYMFVSCPYGIKHIPSLFQRFIAQLFKDMPFVFTYIDNICFSSSSWKEHMEQAAAIIERLNSVNLRIKPSSVNLGNHQIKLLGHLITPHGIGIDPEKQEIMLKWPKPSTGKELASFLGLGTFLRDHIRHYADLTAPFEKIKNSSVIAWTPQMEQQWMVIKRAFAAVPFLKFPDFNKRFVIATDASQTGVGGVLYQPNDENNTITADNIVAIVSKQLNQSQQRYPVYKKELWAVVYCLRKFHTFIHGRRDVIVITDHKPLIHILKQQNLCIALQQWLDVLLDYDLSIVYRPGVLHVIPDALSRMYMSSYADNNAVWGTHDNIKILDAFTHCSSPSDFLCQQSIDAIKPTKAMRRRHELTATQRSGGGESDANSSAQQRLLISLTNDHTNRDHQSETPKKIARTKSYFRTVQDISPSSYNAIVSLMMEDNSSYDISEHDVHEFDEATTHFPLYSVDTSNIHHCVGFVLPHHIPLLRSRDSVIISNLTADEKLAVAMEKRGKHSPASEEHKQKLLEEAHAAGHYGEKVMYGIIDKRGYWWPHMRADIRNIISDCRDCQRFTYKREGFHPSQSVNAEHPGDHLQIDLAQFPESMDGYVYCLVLVDVFTGFVFLKPLKDKEAPTVARAIWEIICIIGIPKIIQCDNGTEFANKILQCLCRLTGIDRRYIAPYNPRADGKVERTVKTVKDTIVKLLHGASALWPLFIPFVQLVYNNKVQDLTGSAPFSLMFGRKMNELRDYTRVPHTALNLDDWKTHQEKVLSLILPSISERIKDKQAEMRKKLDNVRKQLIKDELLPGTIVMIKDPEYIMHPSIRPSTQPMWIGPYTVVRRTLYGPYIIRDDTGVVYPRQVNIDQMKVVYSANHVPVSAHSNTDSNYEVDYVIDHRETKDGSMQYFVKWKGYGTKDNSWVNEDDFNDPQPIERYFKLLLAKKKAKRMSMNSILGPETNSYVISL